GILVQPVHDAWPLFPADPAEFVQVTIPMTTLPFGHPSPSPPKGCYSSWSSYKQSPNDSIWNGPKADNCA
ncbi:MAG: hypothetical protein ACSW8D_02050, partial [Prevotella sp.]